MTLETVTKDSHKFRNLLYSLKVFGGDDCPELSLTGIERAVTSSLPGSDIFVFTDASAKDHYKCSTVIDLCQKKQSRVSCETHREYLQRVTYRCRHILIQYMKLYGQFLVFILNTKKTISRAPLNWFLIYRHKKSKLLKMSRSLLVTAVSFSYVDM